MVIVGLTGGSGSGKTMLCEMLAQRGVHVIDADKISRRVVEPGMSALDEIVAFFGDGVLHKDGTLNRRKLGGIVFADPEKLGMLNNITHKYIIEQIRRELAEVREDIVVIDAPALIESGAVDMCDYVVVLVADEDVRIRRIMERDGLSYDEATERIAAQGMDSQYIRYADIVAENSGDAALGVLADDILRKIGGRLASER